MAPTGKQPALQWAGGVSNRFGVGLATHSPSFSRMYSMYRAEAIASGKPDSSAR